MPIVIPVGMNCTRSGGHQEPGYANFLLPFGYIGALGIGFTTAYAGFTAIDSTSPTQPGLYDDSWYKNDSLIDTFRIDVNQAGIYTVEFVVGRGDAPIGNGVVTVSFDSGATKTGNLHPGALSADEFYTIRERGEVVAGDHIEIDMGAVMGGPYEFNMNFLHLDTPRMPEGSLASKNPESSQTNKNPSSSRQVV